MAEFATMINIMRSHPCIVLWTPFNEAWGQHRSIEVGKWASGYDPTSVDQHCLGRQFLAGRQHRRRPPAS